METPILVVHVLASLAIIALILLQQGKGAAMGASFGAGASQTLFGAQGSGNFFSRMTAFVAVVFFATSFGLAVIAKEKAGVVDDIGIPSAVETEAEVPAVGTEPESDVPAIESPAESAAGEVPTVEAEDVPTAGGGAAQDEVPEAEE